ncbi:ABC transporter substrate-binding protein [uncultured Tateyamaria sp.]|uniref:substrate-binding periplasmic protein n=1 Tax=uncultured Tateyamaria sp. TaxID=455651 RepID=UPI00260F34EE|nr:ABC transporter substrate-binding protein [uncultured Tateyamaria sp.]
MRILNMFQAGAIAITLSCSAAMADEITMTFGDSTPPYAFVDTANGIEVDIIREALAHRDHSLVPQFVPAARVERQFKQGLVDAASKDPGRTLEGPDAHYGDVSVEFFDMLITLADHNLTLAEPSDLDGLQVISFQNAHKFFPDWLAPVHADGRFEQTSDQRVQVLALVDGLADVAVADRNIFNHFARAWAEEEAQELPVLEFTQFQPPLQVRPVFRNAQIRDDFNAGLKYLRETGRYEEILETYLN